MDERDCRAWTRNEDVNPACTTRQKTTGSHIGKQEHQDTGNGQVARPGDVIADRVGQELDGHPSVVIQPGSHLDQGAVVGVEHETLYAMTQGETDQQMAHGWGEMWDDGVGEARDVRVGG